jgi:hypothetical protein
MNIQFYKEKVIKSKIKNLKNNKLKILAKPNKIKIKIIIITIKYCI